MGRCTRCLVFVCRCGSRTDVPSGVRRRRRGDAVASWRSTGCTVRWCVTPCPYPRAFSSLQKRELTHQQRPGFSVRYDRVFKYWRYQFSVQYLHLSGYQFSVQDFDLSEYQFSVQYFDLSGYQFSVQYFDLSGYQFSV